RGLGGRAPQPERDQNMMYGRDGEREGGIKQDPYSGTGHVVTGYLVGRDMKGFQQSEDRGDQDANANGGSHHEQPNNTDVAQIDQIDLADPQPRGHRNIAKAQAREPPAIDDRLKHRIEKNGSKNAPGHSADADGSERLGTEPAGKIGPGDSEESVFSVRGVGGIESAPVDLRGHEAGCHKHGPKGCKPKR